MSAVLVSRTVLPWRRALLIAGLAGLAVINAVMMWLLATHLSGVLTWGDWQQLSALDWADPYATGFYRWAPPAIFAWQLFIAPLGFVTMVALHVMALAAFRDWRPIAALGLTFPFWFDVANGSVLTFVALAAWWAVQGSKAGTIVYVIAFTLMPRPLMLPVLAWLLWHRNDARVALVASGAAVAAFSLAVGMADDWLRVLFTTGGQEGASLWNIAPWGSLGLWWLVAGAPLAAWLTWNGRLGLASLAASPYWLPYYGVMAVLELRDPLRREDRRLEVGRHDGLDA